MPYIVERLATFLVPSGSSRDVDGHHLHIVSTAPCKNSRVLLLTVSTIRDGIWHDTTCLLAAGCHSFIVSPSSVNYRLSVVKNCNSISTMVDGWVYHPKAAFPENLVDQMLAGVRVSDMTPKYVVDYLDAIGL